MSRRVAKEVHLRDWLRRAGQLVDAGKHTYEANRSCRRPVTR